MECAGSLIIMGISQKIVSAVMCYAMLFVESQQISAFCLVHIQNIDIKCEVKSRSSPNFFLTLPTINHVHNPYPPVL